MKRKLGFDRARLGRDIIEEDEDSVVFPAVIARELVQPYPEGLAFKPADELEQAAWTAEGRWITTEKHPDTQLLIRREDVNGRIENARFVKDLLEPKTKRPMERGIRADLRFFKRTVPPVLLDALRSGTRRDVSIGFLYDEDRTPGEWHGQRYDFVQRNLFIDHVAAAVPVGRCPSPFCGIGIDEIGKEVNDMKRNIGLDPFADYETFEDCVADNQDKDDPEAYCAEIQRQAEGTDDADVERAKALFTLSDEEWAALSDEERQAYITQLPPNPGSDCRICDAIDRLGKKLVSVRLAKRFGLDEVLAAIENPAAPVDVVDGVCGDCEYWADQICVVTGEPYPADHGCHIDHFKAEEQPPDPEPVTSTLDQVARAHRLLNLLA